MINETGAATMAGRPRNPGKREKNGRPQRRPIKEKALDEMRGVLEARCRLMGMKPKKDGKFSNAQLLSVRGERFGCEAGRMLEQSTLSKDDRQTYWDAVEHIRKTVLRYRQAIGAPSPNPKNASIAWVRERWETESAGEYVTPEHTSEEERAKRATAAYMALEGWLGRVGPLARSEALRVVIEDQQPKDIHGLILCLISVADGMAGKGHRDYNRKAVGG